MKKLGWHSRGFLPHLEATEIPQMVTFRLYDSIPRAVLEGWQTSSKLSFPLNHRIALAKKIERFLDTGYGNCWLAKSEIAAMAMQALLYFDKQRYDLHAFVIMPNHVHCLLTLLKGFYLNEIIRTWKSFTARHANQFLKRSGPFWQRDYWDRYIRNQQHFEDALFYIENNPVAAGLCSSPAEWRYSSAAL